MNEHTEQKPIETPTTAMPSVPRPNTGRTAGQVWIEEARIVPADEVIE